MMEVVNSLTEKIFDEFKKCADVLNFYGYAKAEGTKILYEPADGLVFGTKNSADLTKLTMDDIEQLNIKRIPYSKKGKKVLIFSQTHYCQKCLADANPFGAALDDMAQIIGPAVYVADGRSSEKTQGKSLKKTLKKTNSCLVLRAVDGKGNGIGYSITLGRTPVEAATAVCIAEKSAEVELKAKCLGGSHALGTKDAKKLKKDFEKSYSMQTKNPVVPMVTLTDEELELRTQLIKLANKLVEKKLIIGTWGNLSVRLDDENILITPSGISYSELEPLDIAKVNIKTLKAEGANKPSSELSMHAAIYNNREDVKAVIHTHATNSSVFAAACKGIPVPSKEVDAREIFGSVIPIAAYAAPGTRELAANVAAALGDKAGVVMAHHGMCVVGADLQETFDRAILFENTARVSWYDYEEDENLDDDEIEEIDETEAVDDVEEEEK